MSADNNKIIEAGKAYYAGGSVPRIAGSDGVRDPYPMEAAMYIPDKPAIQGQPPVEMIWIVKDGEMVEVPKSEVYRGGTVR